MEPQKLSVIVITRNEERDIQGCLESVKEVADEIVVVDSGSTDQTIPICQKFNCEIYHRDWTGYSDQKQCALEKAKGPWVLNLDADERMSFELKKEVMNLMTDSEALQKKNGYQIPFKTFFYGRQLRFGGVGREKHLRFFKKEKASYGNQSVHEKIKVEGSVGHLSGAILHKSYRNLSEYLEKFNSYTSAIAQEKYNRGERFSFFHHFRLPWEFFVRTIVKLGFLDGEPGLLYALLSSLYAWMKYVKLRDWGEKNS